MWSPNFEIQWVGESISTIADKFICLTLTMVTKDKKYKKNY